MNMQLFLQMKARFTSMVMSIGIKLEFGDLSILIKCLKKFDVASPKMK